METVEILIKIPKDKYDRLDYVDSLTVKEFIKNGVPLPKGHGRLIDADNMKHIDAIQRGDFNSIESIRAWIDIIPTVVEADKAESEDKK